MSFWGGESRARTEVRLEMVVDKYGMRWVADHEYRENVFETDGEREGQGTRERVYACSCVRGLGHSPRETCQNPC